MRSKLSTTLLLLLGISSLTLMTMGVKLAREERTVLRTQYQRLYYQWLIDYRDTIEKHVRERAELAVQDAVKHGNRISAFRRVTATNGLVDQVVVVGANGILQYPVPGPGLLPPEKDFLKRAGHVFQSPGFRPASGKRGMPQEGFWQPYFWSDGLHILYFSQVYFSRAYFSREDSGTHSERGEEVYVGVELNKTRLLSEIAAILPTSIETNVTSKMAAVILRNEQRQEVHRITSRVFDGIFEETVALDLAPPLHSFQLSFLVPKGMWDAAFYGSALFTIIPAIVAVIGVLSALTVYFYREHTREVREAAQRVNFVNQVSHELKTPLTNIRMYAELLAERLEHVEERAVSQAEIIVSESQRLSRLILTILNFSLREKSKLEIHPARAVIADVIKGVLEQFRLSLKEKEILVLVSVQEASGSLIDADALAQILGNLFSNVLKYASSGMQLRIEGWRQGDLLYLRIEDRGPGVPADSAERIFEPFYRTSSSLTDGVSGAGIGLTIARDLARLHGGDLVLEQRSPGASFLLHIKAVLLRDTRGEDAQNNRKEVRLRG